jgi:hypothetical protein
MRLPIQLEADTQKYFVLKSSAPQLLQQAQQEKALHLTLT